jgi:hypothetical protein
VIVVGRTHPDKIARPMIEAVAWVNFMVNNLVAYALGGVLFKITDLVVVYPFDAIRWPNEYCFGVH